MKIKDEFRSIQKFRKVTITDGGVRWGGVLIIMKQSISKQKMKKPVKDHRKICSSESDLKKKKLRR